MIKWLVTAWWPILTEMNGDHIWGPWLLLLQSFDGLLPGSRRELKSVENTKRKETRTMHLILPQLLCSLHWIWKWGWLYLHWLDAVSYQNKPASLFCSCTKSCSHINVNTNKAVLLHRMCGGWREEKPGQCAQSYSQVRLIFSCIYANTRMLSYCFLRDNRRRFYCPIVS